MANAAAYKTLDGFKNQLSYATLEYDFANDGGVVSTIPLGVCAGDMIVHSAVVYVPTACTSGGSATVAIGAADPDSILDTTSGAVANLTLNAVLFETTQQQYIASADTIDLAIAVEALTAGKIQVKLIYEMI